MLPSTAGKLWLAWNNFSPTASSSPRPFSTHHPVATYPPTHALLPLGKIPESLLRYFLNHRSSGLQNKLQQRSRCGNKCHASEHRKALPAIATHFPADLGCWSGGPRRERVAILLLTERMLCICWMHQLAGGLGKAAVTAASFLSHLAWAQWGSISGCQIKEEDKQRDKQPSKGEAISEAMVVIQEVFSDRFRLHFPDLYSSKQSLFFHMMDSVNHTHTKFLYN